MFRIIVLILSGLLFSGKGMAQADSVALRLQQIKNTMADSIRIALGDEIPLFLKKIEFGKYSEGSAVQFLGYKKCMNEEAELFSWALPLNNGQMFYNWFRFKEGNKIYLQKGFSDYSGENVAWLYYDFIGFKKDGRTYFALLGWNKTRKTNQKIVQIASFKSNGTLGFNHKLMRKGNSRSAALRFEYAPDGSMMMKPDNKGKRIIFDHLSPVDKKYEGYFMFYGPDASYDALVLKKGEWWYEVNVRE